MHRHLTSRWTTRTVTAAPASDVRLLVVDDYQAGAEAITAVLLVEGYDARCVLSGHAALELSAAWIPDIALLDINMPEMDGFALARQLRQSRKTQHVALVAFTSQDERITHDRGVAAGFDAYCQKSGTTDALLHLLARMTH
ncbi:response regulator [Caballeronia pedi]|uniref:Response regulator n=1 Tax=Caballeronia pedi TaxID=1777141 RepID=A0A158BUX4_9BURK|nr:response regulator [Caballeronia pedi]SAK73909.1 response regulator [Caballeronia pedi]